MEDRETWQLLYGGTAVAWGLFAAMKTRKRRAPRGEVWVVFVVNAVLCPVAILLAWLWEATD